MTDPKQKPKEKRCTWCLKNKLKNPEWEQKNLKGKWKPLCSKCANRRLNNPYNALLDMRKIENPNKNRQRRMSK